MAEKVAKAGIKREMGWLYFIDKRGNIVRQREAAVEGDDLAGGEGPVELVQKVGLRREDGFLYYVDKQGDVSRAKMKSTKQP